MADHFLTKTQIELSQCIELGDEFALEAYPKLHQLLMERAGPEAARLFAEPLLSRGNDQAPAGVSWYTDVEGSGVPLARLDDAGQAAMSNAVNQQLATLRGLLDDANDGPLVAAALHVSDANDIWSVGGLPVIINWGMLPSGMKHGDVAARTTHYAQTLGRFLPLGAAPPLNSGERSAMPTAQPASSATAQNVGQPAKTAAMVGTGAAVGAGAAKVASADTSAAGGAGGNDTPPPVVTSAAPSRVPLWAWLPLVLMLLLAGVVLIWLLMPGSRIFPDTASDRVITDEAALAAAENGNRALTERLQSLQTALNGATCEADGTLLMPDGRTLEGLLPPDPNDRADIPGAIREAAPKSILPPDPERVQIPQSDGVKSTASLLNHMEERTAIVLATSQGGLSSGTGFFVGPDLLVTNHHVIANSGSGKIYITNKDLGTLHEAQILKTMGPFEQTGGDFALLRVPGAEQPSFTVLQANESLRLQSVIAAGYPGDLLRDDVEFKRLREGDRQAVPELSVTDGTVSTEQTMNADAKVVVHSAPISTGNSGGPLIDMCGRLVGVNTFVRKGSLRNLNFALGSESLMRFLANTDALPQVVSKTCKPQIERPMTASLEKEEELPKLPALKQKSE